MTILLRSPFIMLLSWTLACGGPSTVRGPVVVDQEAEHEAIPDTQDVAIEPAREGSISRSQLLATLDQGVGRFLQNVALTAEMRSGRFAGWQISRYDNPWVDLQPGDVVTTINGQNIETPSQAQALWDSLRDSPAIVVQAFRAGAPFELRFQVVGDPSTEVP